MEHFKELPIQQEHILPIFIYKNKWNGIITTHKIQAFNSLNPTNVYVAQGTNWATATYLCNVANYNKSYPGGGNDSFYLPDVGIVTFSTPLNLGIPDAVVGLPPAVGTTVVCAGNGYDGTPSMDPTTYNLPGTMEQWNTIIDAGTPGYVSRTYFYATGFAPGTCPLNGKILADDSGGPTFFASNVYDSNGVMVSTNWVLCGSHVSQTGNGDETGQGVDTMLAEPDTLSFITNNSFEPQTLAVQAQSTNAVVTWGRFRYPAKRN